ncbi:hypothetical protein FACS189468_5170 [Spirochaetia bacterium]|nr:hypothetical protein FACS189468_5170 [Spirochaetia bacterium]
MICKLVHIALCNKDFVLDGFGKKFLFSETRAAYAPLDDGFSRVKAGKGGVRINPPCLTPPCGVTE